MLNIFHTFVSHNKLNNMKLADAFKTNPNAILIHSGILFDVFNPKAENVNVVDIAHALSNICRYGGHCPKFYSVAQHSVLCSLQPGTPQEQMEFLMHDSSEAYLMDLPRPIKRNMPSYVTIEESLLKVICEHYKLTYPLSERVHEVDNILLHFEYDNFYTNPNSSFDFWVPERAKAEFLARFNELKFLIDNEKALV
jgi:uncharacterized protein